MGAMRRALAGVAVFVTFAVLSGCEGSLYYTSDPIEAWVVDAETGKPIEGAIVTANWQLLSFGFDTGGRKLHQLAVMETVTDTKGRFFFPGFTQLNVSLAVLGDDDPRIRIFKPGYGYVAASSSNWPNFDKVGAHRRSRANGMTFKMRKEPDIRRYARAIDSLDTDLSGITERGYGSQIPRLTMAMNCERQRIKRIDPTILLSVPYMSPKEVRCDVP